MIKLQTNNHWESHIPSNTIFIISPGAGTFRNKKAYQILEKNFNVIYFGKTGGIYDKYPTYWENNSFVESTGKHLGGIAELIENKIYKDKIIPCLIIAGSRGGQVTIGKVWERIWRGPTIIINAGCLTTQTVLPKDISILFIIMENDYFKSVNTPQKVKKLTNKNEKIKIIYLPNHYHMPNLNNELVELLLYTTLFITNKIITIPLKGIELH
tara:strand:+ start:989 stop:1624 length:636 start_codon:yes stop_codon:yes gene_type:complete